MDDMERNQLIAVIVIVVVVGAAGAYVLLSQPGVVLAEDQSIVYETIGLPEYMDPHKNYETAGSWIHYNIYETLMTYPWDTADSNPTNPLLATGYTISGDGLNYTFTLRQGVTFHDGTPFNATCVQMNIWRMLGRGWDDGWGPVWMIAEPILGGQAVEDAVFEFGDGTPEHIAAWANWKANVSAVVVKSDYEVVIRLAYPFAPFVAALTYEVGAIISPTYFMAHEGMAPGGTTAWMDEHACGTGPFYLDSWIQDDRVFLIRNDNYWRKDLAKLTHPYAGTVTNVTIKLNPDVNSRILNIRAGTTDSCDWPVTNAYDVWNNVTVIGNGKGQSMDPNLKCWTGYPTFDVVFLGFNMNPYINQSGVITESPWTNFYARKALSYAFDYEALIKNVCNGIAMPLQGPIPKGMAYHDDNLFMFKRNMTAAVEAWNLAMDSGLDDILANNSYTLNIYYNEGNTQREAASLLVAQAIQEIIDDPASTNPTEELQVDAYAAAWADYLALNRNRQLPMFFLGWAPDYADADNYASPFVKSTGTFPARVGLAGSLGEGGVAWDAETVDGWIVDAAKSSDPATRTALYKDIQEAIVAQCAFLWCYQGVSFQVERVEMNGYVFNPMHDMYFYHYYKTA